MTRWRWWWTVAGVLLIAPAARADDQGGWGYLIDKLVADGVPRQRVREVFDDPRMPPFVGLEFSPDRPREPKARYRGFLTPNRIALARRCREDFASALDAAEQAHGVPASLLAAVLFVETGCGEYTGSHTVVYRLARLAMANEPANVASNVWRLAEEEGGFDPDTEARLQERARYLEATFYPEVRALFEIAARNGLDPLDIHGSPSGAFGYPQFLPTSYLAHGVDANGDGRVSLYNAEDAAASCAHYFAARGWRPGLSAAERRVLVWEYNHSDAYVDTVLALAASIENPGVAVRTTRVKPRTGDVKRARARVKTTGKRQRGRAR